MSLGLVGHRVKSKAKTRRKDLMQRATHKVYRVMRPCVVLVWGLLIVSHWAAAQNLPEALVESVSSVRGIQFPNQELCLRNLQRGSTLLGTPPEIRFDFEVSEKGRTTLIAFRSGKEIGAPDGRYSVVYAHDGTFARNILGGLCEEPKTNEDEKRKANQIAFVAELLTQRLQTLSKSPQSSAAKAEGEALLRVCREMFLPSILEARNSPRFPEMFKPKDNPDQFSKDKLAEEAPSRGSRADREPHTRRR